MWNINEAIELCKLLEPIAARRNCHVALTGGLLYKEGARKDCDIIVYKETFDVELDRDALLVDFLPLGIEREFHRVVKCTFRGKPVDLIFPELDGEYLPGEGAEAKEDVTLALAEQL